MRIFRSKTSFIYGTVILGIVAVLEASILFRKNSVLNMNFIDVFLIVIPIFIALYYFIDGMQTIKISDKSVKYEIMFIPIKEFEIKDINEAGTAKLKIGKEKYARQLYVSKVQLSEEELENISLVKDKKQVIWFYYSENGQSLLEKALGMNEE